jgi:hypothetical protein
MSILNPVMVNTLESRKMATNRNINLESRLIMLIDLSAIFYNVASYDQPDIATSTGY